ncbi:MAG: hypothetical protein JW810_13235 [Sedimentisphaerales bacterium]|nr:hypothetical protein [Sedimentisphaerales bacterium]
MNLYRVVLSVAQAAQLNTGRQIKAEVVAHSRLDAALIAEGAADVTLNRPDIEYTHAVSVIPVNKQAPAMSVAA